MTSSRFGSRLAAIVMLATTAASSAHASESAVDDKGSLIDALEEQIAAQAAQLAALQRTLSQQEGRLNDMRQRVQAVKDMGEPGASLKKSPVATSTSAPAEKTIAMETVGIAVTRPTATPEVAPLFDQPGVLTGRGKVVLEPSLQYSYSSSNRVALVGYTVIPSILVGVVDVREVKRSTLTGAMTARFGITNRLEVEGKIPWVYRSDTSIGRELLTGTSTASAFSASGQGIGDMEFTARYQLNKGGQESPYYVGSLRFKSRTGKDPFQVVTSKGVVGFSDDGVQTQLPTGSGFYGLQPALTVLYPSDPAVFFGTLSYLNTFKRNNVVRRTDAGPESLGSIAPGGIIGFNFGMGLALNEKSSFSIGYDHSIVGRTRQNGDTAADSVRLQLGTLLLGYSLKLNSTQNLNVSLGAGLTRDTPDVTLSVRIPTTF